MQRSPFSPQRKSSTARRSARGLALLAGLLTIAAASSAAAQEPSDIRRGAPPLVLILLDTSASMEFLDEENVYPGCVYNPANTAYDVTCNNDADCSTGQSCLQVSPGNYRCRPLSAAIPDYLSTTRPQPTTAFSYNYQFQKSRAVQAREVLGGRFDNFWCEEVSRTGAGDFFTLDNASPIPHFEPRYSSQLTESGLLFLNRDFVRFGFFPLDTERSSNDEWSWPQTAQDWEEDNWNLGVRDERATVTPAVWVGDLSDPEEGKRRVSSIERSLSEFIPYGGTPLAAAFADINAYLGDTPNTTVLDKHILPKSVANPTGDTFSACRSKEIILISDGFPTHDDCAPCGPNEIGPCPSYCNTNGYDYTNYPYKTTLKEIVDLRANHADARVHVIGFNVGSQGPCPNTGGGIPNDRPCVDQMALAGGTDADGINTNKSNAYIADDQLTLTRSLTRVLNSIVNGTSARTATRATTRTLNRNRTAEQYQFSAAFTLDEREHLWKGVLERVTLDCNGNVTSIVDYSDKLDAIPDAEVQNTRRILAALRRDVSGAGDINSDYYQEASNVLIKINGPNLATRVSGLTQAELNRWFRAGVLQERTAGGLDPVDFDDIIDILQGLDPVRNSTDTTVVPPVTKRRLGGIYHASPVIVGGPELQLDIPGYDRFANAVNPIDNPRRTAVAVGSKDGLLHYFNGEYNPDDNTSPLELWAFMPEELRSKVYLQKATHIYGVDAAPVVRDVRMYRGAAAAPAGYVDPVQDGDPIAFNDIWSTVLVGGLRAGGRAYYALDVTYPENPRFLWELNPELETRRVANLRSGRDRLASPNDIAIEQPLIGLTYGEPGVGTVVLREGGATTPLTEKGVAILGGGAPLDADDVEQGRAMYVVELATGRIIRRFLQATYRDGVTTRIKAPIVGSVALYSDFPGTFITRAFVGDAEGRLYRLDMRNPDPAQWSLEEFHNAFDGLADSERRPIYLKPVTATGPNGEVVVLYGTGDVDNLELRDQKNRLFSLSEEIEYSAATGLVTGVRANINWMLELEGGEKLTGAPLVFDRTAYFSTFRPDQTEVCSFGNARIYAVDYFGDNPERIDDVIGQFVAEELTDNVNSGAQVTVTNNEDRFFDLGDDSVVFGLELAGSPSCLGDTPDALLNGDPNAATNGANAAGANDDLTLIAQTGVASANAGGNVPGSKINKLNFKLQRPPTAAFETAWTKVLN